MEAAPAPSGPTDKLSDDRLGEPSKAIRQRVEAARKIQQARFGGRGLTCNADMGVAEVRESCGGIVPGAACSPLPCSNWA